MQPDELRAPIRLIGERLAKHCVIPFLGAGASFGCTLRDADEALDEPRSVPSAHDLAQLLAVKTSFPDDAERTLATVAQYFEVVGGRDTLEEELRSLFARRYVPSRLHHHLAAQAASMLFVTTNYDDLLEQALDEADKAYDVVIQTTDPALGERLLWWKQGADQPERVTPKRLYIDLEKTNVVYKMHGAVDRLLAARDQYVITEDDYVEFLIRLTRGKAIPAIFAEPFQRRHFLFLGYGLRDWNLRVILSRLERDLGGARGRTSWAIDAAPSAVERRFWQNRGVEIYKMTCDEFVTRLTAA